ncbi:DNA repair protein XRCC4 [Syngnathus typhle]|uniref:DNA repair protein XRCC4 n=1 Tax=Syngnathus typhle TaxID=161592 RepID=UPI002A6AEC8B|nr:DNA repair protein XRCC4 [Syngnathus typhle]XP_061148629.1 DNA repair protein XRCC4 [Syngnathus typhle]
MHSSVREIPLSSEPDSSYFLRVDESGRGLAYGFQLLLSDGRHAWSGEASEAWVRQEAAELEMSTEKYVQDLREALTGEAGVHSYRFALAPAAPDGALTLTYDKVQKDISFRLGSTRLGPVTEPERIVGALLTRSLERATSLERHNRELREHNLRLRREHVRFGAELERYASGKEALEAELYARFLHVLNEKKAKMRGLRQTLEQLREAGSGEKRERAAEEAEGEAMAPPPPPPLPAVASSGGARSPGPCDDSLMDIADVAPSRKRRFRHRPGPLDAAVERAHASKSDSPAAASQQQPAASEEVEDLFEDL